MKNLSLATKLFWLIICSIGNIYQVSRICSEFFKYEIVSTVNADFPDIFIAPALSICLDEIELVNFDKLERIKPNIKKLLNYQSYSDEKAHEELTKIDFGKKIDFQVKMFLNLSIKQRNEVTSTADEIFTFCGLTNPETSVLTE